MVMPPARSGATDVLYSSAYSHLQEMSSSSQALKLFYLLEGTRTVRPPHTQGGGVPPPPKGGVVWYRLI